MTRYALAPVEATEEMIEAFYDGAEVAKKASFSTQKFPYGIAPAEWFPPAYEGAIAASPGGGRITAEQRIRAAIALYAAQEGATEESCARLFRGDPGEHCGDCTKVAGTCIRCLREQILAEVDAVIRGLGLQVEGDGQ